MYKGAQSQKGEVIQPFDSAKAKFFYVGAYTIANRAKQLATEKRSPSKSLDKKKWTFSPWSLYLRLFTFNFL